MESDIDNFDELVADAKSVISLVEELNKFLETAFSALTPEQLSDFDNIDLNQLDKRDLFMFQCTLPAWCADDHTGSSMSLMTDFSNETPTPPGSPYDVESASSMRPLTDFSNETPVSPTSSYDEETEPGMYSSLVLWNVSPLSPKSSYEAEIEAYAYPWAVVSDQLTIKSLEDENKNPEDSIEFMSVDDGNKECKVMCNTDDQLTIGAKLPTAEEHWSVKQTKEELNDLPQLSTVEEVEQSKGVEQSAADDPSTTNEQDEMAVEQVANSNKPMAGDEPDGAARSVKANIKNKQNKWLKSNRNPRSRKHKLRRSLRIQLMARNAIRKFLPRATKCPNW